MSGSARLMHWGSVWHGHYITYFEDGREAFGRQYGISYLDIQKNGYSRPIVKTSTEHFLPLKYGETFRIETNFINVSAAKWCFDIKFLTNLINWFVPEKPYRFLWMAKGIYRIIIRLFFRNGKKNGG